MFKFLEPRKRAFSKKPEGITLRENADEFVKHLVKRAKSSSTSISAYYDDWPAMVNEEWRKYVTEQLLLTNAFIRFGFYEPDMLDGWTFTAYLPEQNLAKRKLDDYM